MVKYKLEKNGDFVIEDYNRAKAFSSFFPGIAGLHGIPLWAFYVNRGQCMASFGIENKDSAILEFMPANQAYNMTPLKGFRTFLKLKVRAGSIFYEPFRAGGKGISTKMIINPSSLRLEEINKRLGIKIEVTYITVPGESFAGLARRVVIENISNKKIEAEVVDGLPHIATFGMTEWHQKHMSRTIEAWMRVLNAENAAPFYNLKVDPQDTPELEYIERGNFYMACRVDGKRAVMLKPLVDPDVVFGSNGDISYPRVFVEDGFSSALRDQRTEGKTPSAMAYVKFSINAEGKKKLVSLIGNAGDVSSVSAIRRKINGNADYFEEKLLENEEIIKRLEGRIFTKSSSEEFDFYTRQTYLDNLLRGGVPISLDTPRGPFVYYAYARKHGDLERDYNAFLLQPAYYSQGNGAYRDMNQNRRNDALLNPDVKDENIRTFVDAIQPDGFNPHRIQGIKLTVKNSAALNKVLRKYVKYASGREKVKGLLLTSFTPGSLMFLLEKEGILPKNKRDGLLARVLTLSVKEEVISPGEGYWVDHWTYNIDLLENYLACYPDKLRALLLGRRDFTFYDTYLRVMPRDEKYVYINGKVRQSGAVIEDEAKKNIIEARDREKYKVRTDFGKGKVYKTDLLTKLICIIANKMASLDPFGVGIEMEAGKPGWCDGLNGLPGILGSSLCEVFEIKRMILFVRSSMEKLKVNKTHKLSLPYELYGFLTDLEKSVNKNLTAGSKRGDFLYWEYSQTRKEKYRKEVWPGFSGREKAVSAGDLERILDRFLLKLKKGLKKGFSKKDGMTYSYYINEVKQFGFIREGGKKKLNKEGQATVKALSFSHKPLSLFLEGPVHAMRVMKKDEARSLYNAVRKSDMFDHKLKMYKMNESLKGMPLEIGRSAIFTPGWLENESVWLHMEYKYLLEVLKSGLFDEFFVDFKNCLVAFQDPARYGRSILENSSFIASSSYPASSIHGNGFVARLTGTTTEYLTIWLLMALGKDPFKLDADGRLCFEPDPTIPGWLFTQEESITELHAGDWAKKKLILAKNTYTCCLLGKTPLIYRNPKRRNTFGRNGVAPVSVILRKKGRSDVKLNGGKVPSPYAVKIRDGFYDKINVELA
ncbi:MAG: hypothetical protein ISS26_01860 [Candidatus Omnitrophica bacterium]|nr:hypothetical protein [Candidatus Omnitrophota bacterium]